MAAACKNTSRPRSRQCSGELTRAAGSRHERNALPCALPSLNTPNPYLCAPLAASGRYKSCVNGRMRTASPGVTAGAAPHSPAPLLRKVTSDNFSGRPITHILPADSARRVDMSIISTRARRLSGSVCAAVNGR